MVYNHIIPTIGYKAVFSRFVTQSAAEETDKIILPVMAFAVCNQIKVCGLVIDANGNAVTCEDATFGTFLGYIVPEDADPVTKRIASLIRFNQVESLETGKEV